MISRSGTFLLILLISLPIFFFGAPAYAHQLDYCIEILNDAAQIAVNGNSKFKLKDYPEYAEIAKGCNKDLKDEGLITLTQVSKSLDIANKVLKGEIAVEDLDEAKKNQRENALKQKEQNWKKIRKDICSKKNKKDAFACVGE